MGKGKTMSAGTEFAQMVRKNLQMNTRTRNNRGGHNLKRDIIEAIGNAVFYPGYYNEERTALYRAAYPAYCSYTKHVTGGRVAPMVAYQIEQMSPWQFAGFLGEMIDAGISNTFEGEMYFNSMREVAFAA